MSREEFDQRYLTPIIEAHSPFTQSAEPSAVDNEVSVEDSEEVDQAAFALAIDGTAKAIRQENGPMD